jgi:hypothetical protein
MAPTNQNPPAGVADGLNSNAFPGGNCNQDTAPKVGVAQAKIDLLVDDVVDTAGWLISQLSVLPSQRVAGDVTGFIYTLRRSRPYWKHIAETAVELVAANDERLSGLRQESDQ